MASLTITVPDEQVDRIRTAFGSTNIDTNEVTLATVEEVREQLRAYIISRVTNYEYSVAVQSAMANVASLGLS